MSKILARHDQAPSSPWRLRPGCERHTPNLPPKRGGHLHSHSEATGGARSLPKDRTECFSNAGREVLQISAYGLSTLPRSDAAETFVTLVVPSHEWSGGSRLAERLERT